VLFRSHRPNGSPLKAFYMLRCISLYWLLVIIPSSSSHYIPPEIMCGASREAFVLVCPGGGENNTELVLRRVLKQRDEWPRNNMHIYM
jgi:hypothetical protein